MARILDFFYPDGRLVVIVPRERAVEAAYHGLKETGIPLVGMKGDALFPAGYADDIGICYLVPKLSLLLGLTSDEGGKLFVLLVYALSFVLASAGFILLFKRGSTRVFTTLILLLTTTYAFFTTHDIYYAHYFSISLIPLFMAAVRRCRWEVRKFFIANHLRRFAVAGLSLRCAGRDGAFFV